MPLLGSTAVIGVGMKRQSDNARAQGLAAHHETDRRPARRVGALGEAHRDRPVDAWPESARRDNSDRRALRRNNLRPLARWRASVGPNADTLTIGTMRQRALNPLGARKTAFDAPSLLNGPGESGFDRVDGFVEFMPVEAEAGLKPQRIPRAEADRRDVGLAEEHAGEPFRLG